MDRRSFILSLVGGVAAASVGAMAMAQAAQTTTLVDDALLKSPAVASIDAKTLDETDAEFSQYYRRRRMMHHRRRMQMRRMRRSDRRTRPYSQR